jgi:iron complex transport system substrate-binding protein
MRIASLVPSATEMLFALGLGRSVVGVTHECDYPAGASDLPHLTRSVIPEGLHPADIDREVRERTEQGKAIYELDEFLLDELQPDLIVTQQVCAVCAVSFDDVSKVAERIGSRPTVLSQDPTTIGEVLADIRRLGEAADAVDAAEDLVDDAAERLDDISLLVQDAERPRVAALEWLDPVFVGGHWVPQMIELAGGEDMLGFPGEKSRTAEWEEVAATQPQVVVAMPCGYYAEQAAAHTMAQAARVAALGGERVVAVDAAAYFSRPGPRLVEGVELLAHVLHPDLVPDPPPEARAIVLDLSRSALRG